LAAALALIACIIILSLVPPISKDALTHHLAVPKLYLRHGGIYEIPSMSFSYYPMNLDILYMIPLGFGNDIAPKLIHFCFALLTAWLIFGYLKRRLNTSYALAGALFFLSIPIIVKLSITVYVDLGLIFFHRVTSLVDQVVGKRISGQISGCLRDLLRPGNGNKVQWPYHLFSADPLRCIYLRRVP
jgi:hypothetical protein